MPIRRTFVSMPMVLAGALVALSLMGPPAWAHGDIREATPGKGSTAKEPPAQVRLVLAEPPAKGSEILVTDGCAREVSGDASIQGDVLSVDTPGGRSGRWTVDLRSISSVDGHLVKDSFTFEVAGKADCTPGEEGSDDDIVSEETSSRPPIANPDAEDGAFPIVAFALVTVAVVGIAIAVRRPRKTDGT